MNEAMIQTVAKLEERLDQHDRRITKNEDLTAQIHELNSSVKSLYNEVRGQNSRIEKILTGIETSQTKQGERIGELEKKGSKRMEDVIRSVVALVVTAVVMYFVGRAM